MSAAAKKRDRAEPAVVRDQRDRVEEDSLCWSAPGSADEGARKKMSLFVWLFCAAKDLKEELGWEAAHDFAG
jgi:hypothetical protein